MNKNAFKIAGVSEKDYRVWCIENKKLYYKAEVKKEFFSKIQSGLLIKDSKGRIVKAYSNKEE